MAAKKPVTVRILDQGFLINTDAPPERVKKIADYLNRNLKDALTKSRGASPYNAAILAALNICEKYFDALDRQAALKQRVSEKSRRVLDLLDRVGAAS